MVRKGDKYTEQELRDIYGAYAHMKGWCTKDERVNERVEFWRDMSGGPVGLAIDWYESGGVDPYPQVGLNATIGLQGEGGGQNVNGLAPIPKDKQMYDGFEVAGVGYRRDAAITFASGRDQRLMLEREPRNRHDPNAIKVIGFSKGLSSSDVGHIGYVPKDMAAAIVASGMWGELQVRLRKVYVSDNGFVAVWLDLLGPKGRVKEFCAAWPATT